MTVAARPALAPAPRFSPPVVLAMLLVVYTFNFLDRQILGILVEPIKADLGLTDTQLGALGGIAFAMLYSTMAIPLAMVADRTSRSWTIAVSLAVWSGFTALCGTATGFWQLFAYRLGVGVGEAGGVAPSYALIADYFPPARRARALAIYSLGVPVGLAAGVLLGAYIAQAVDWRASFIAVGLAGMVIAPLFKYVVRDLPRPAATAPMRAVPAGGVFGILAGKASFWLMAFAASMSSVSGYGLAFWTASILRRSYGLDLVQASYFFGSLLLLGGVAGVLAGGVLADRLGQADRGAYARLPAIAWLVAGPLFIAAFLSPSPTVAWLLLLLPNALNILWLGPLTTAIQHLVPQHMRATASACFLFINNLIGIGLGSWLLGGLSDAMTPRFGAEALRYSAIALVFSYFLASALALLAVRPLRREWVD